MRNKYGLALLFAILLPTATVANVRHVGRASFTVEQQTIIRRNALLVPLARRDPQLLRRALEAIEKSKNEPAQPDRGGDRSAPGAGSLPDPAHNPDLDQLLQASPEATFELIQLIKKAGGRKNN